MDGLRISPFSQETLDDHEGGFGEDVIVDQLGLPDRLKLRLTQGIR